MRSFLEFNSTYIVEGIYLYLSSLEQIGQLVIRWDCFHIGSLNDYRWLAGQACLNGFLNLRWGDLINELIEFELSEFQAGVTLAEFFKPCCRVFHNSTVVEFQQALGAVDFLLSNVSE